MNMLRFLSVAVDRYLVKSGNLTVGPRRRLVCKKKSSAWREIYFSSTESLTVTFEMLFSFNVNLTLMLSRLVVNQNLGKIKKEQMLPLTII